MYGLGNPRLFSLISFRLSQWADLAHMRKGLVMVAPRKTKKVFCTIVRLPAADDRFMVASNRLTSRPSELVPWADPYIAQLVQRLQDEVRDERNTASAGHALRADLDPPSPSCEPDWDWADDAQRTLCDDFFPDVSE